LSDAFVRTATEADGPAIIALLHELNRVEAAIEADRDTTEEAALACYAVCLRHVADGGAAFVSEIDGTVAGYICAAVDMAPPFVKAAERRHVWVADLVVAERWRGRGIATLLLAAVEEFARSAKVRHLVIGALAGNAVANAVYEKRGFRPYTLNRIKVLA